MTIAEMLKEAGLDAASKLVGDKILRVKRMTAAYDKYRFIEPATFDRFQAALKERTLKKDPCKWCHGSGKTKEFAWMKAYEVTCIGCHGDGWRTQRYEKLVLTPLNEYTEIPPMDCLLDLQKAVQMEVDGARVFDRFEVGTIKEIVEQNPKIDPVVFGIIDGCVDKFCITQWDDDVSFEQIMEAEK